MLTPPPRLPAPARQQHILRLLGRSGSVRASELARELRVTAMTLWRDLEGLAEQGLLRRVHGGAVAAGADPLEADFESKAAAAARAKERIARFAVRHFVRAGDVIALEGGTTVAAVAEALPDEGVSIVTNSLPVALRIRAMRPRLAVSLPSGWLSAVSGNLCGPETVRNLRQSRATVCFISCSGYDLHRGPLDPNPLEIEAKRAMASASSRVILLLDHGKFHTLSRSVAIHPGRLHAVVTDKPPPAAAADKLRRLGVPVHIVGARPMAPRDPAPASQLNTAFSARRLSRSSCPNRGSL